MAFFAGFYSLLTFFLLIIAAFHQCDLGISPKSLDVVILPNVFLKNVYHDVYVIDQHPFGVIGTFYMPGFVMNRFADRFLDGIYDGIDVGVGSAAANYEVVANCIVNGP